MFNKLLLVCILSIGLFANENKNNSSFFEDLVNEVTSTVDSNLTDKMKLENMQEYIMNLKLNDKVDKKKYKFNIMAHHENYMLLAGYTNKDLVEKHYNTNGTRDTSRDYNRERNEAQFQLSIKVPLFGDFLGTGADLFTAYTQNSYWQVYDAQHSSPFRETNYMPELFLEWQPKKKLGESTLEKVRFALIHQSNGQDLGKSRSWNRTEMYFLFKNKNIFYGANVWDRWDEDQKSSPSQIDGDDNVGLEDYVGKQKYFVKYKDDKYSATIAHQNDIFGYNRNKGNTKLDFTFPSGNDNFDLFVRYFHGYGESLIDYDVKINRVSIGIMIADWN